MIVMDDPSPGTIASIIVALVALLVAVLALRYELVRDRTPGVTASIVPVQGKRRVIGEPNRKPTWGTVAWKVTFEITGSAPMMMVSAAVWDGAPHRVWAAPKLPEEIPVWTPGDAPITFQVKRKHDDHDLENLAVGLIWARPQAFREGITDQAVRWQLKPYPPHRDGRFRAPAPERWSYFWGAWRRPNRFRLWLLRWWYPGGWRDDLKERGARRRVKFDGLA